MEDMTVGPDCWGYGRSKRGGGGGREKRKVSIVPAHLLLQLGAEQQVAEQKDVPQLSGALHQLHHEAVLQELPVLGDPIRRPVNPSINQPTNQDRARHGLIKGLGRTSPPVSAGNAM